MVFSWSNGLPLGHASFRSHHLNTATVATSPVTRGSSGGVDTMGTNPLVRGTSGGTYYGFPKKYAPQAQVLNT